MLRFTENVTVTVTKLWHHFPRHLQFLITVLVINLDRLGLVISVKKIKTVCLFWLGPDKRCQSLNDSKNCFSGINIKAPKIVYKSWDRIWYLVLSWNIKPLLAFFFNNKNLSKLEQICLHIPKNSLQDFFFMKLKRSDQFLNCVTFNLVWVAWKQSYTHQLHFLA